MACPGPMLSRSCVSSAHASVAGVCLITGRPQQGVAGLCLITGRPEQGAPAASTAPRRGSLRRQCLGEVGSCTKPRRGDSRRQCLREVGSWRWTYQPKCAPVGPVDPPPTAPVGPSWSSSVPSVTAQAGGRGVAVASAAPGASGPSPPTSRGEAVRQAGASLSALLSVKGGAKLGKKGFKGGAKGAPRFRVELPLEDEREEAVASLALDLLRATKSLPAQGVVLCFTEPPLEQAAQRLLDKAPIPGVTAAVSLPAVKQSLVDASLAVFVGMRDSDVPAVQAAMSALGPRPAIAVNPDWEDDGPAGSPGALMKSFQVAYSYLPLRIQGFFTNAEGAVLLTASEGVSSATPWGIYVKDKGQFKCLLRLKKRPTQTDIEQVFYMVAAENSPVTKAISWTKSLTGSK